MHRADVSVSKAETIAFIRDCGCAGAPATWGAVRIHQPNPESGEFFFELIPGPSCNNCGKAWKLLEDPH